MKNIPLDMAIALNADDEIAVPGVPSNQGDSFMDDNIKINNIEVGDVDKHPIQPTISDNTINISDGISSNNVVTSKSSPKPFKNPVLIVGIILILSCFTLYIYQIISTLRSELNENSIQIDKIITILQTNSTNEFINGHDQIITPNITNNTAYNDDGLIPPKTDGIKSDSPFFGITIAILTGFIALCTLIGSLIYNLISGIRSEVSAFRSEIKTIVASLHTEMKTNIASLHTEMKTNIASLNNKIDYSNELLTLKYQHLNDSFLKLNTDQKELRSEVKDLTSEVKEFKSEVKGFMLQVNQKLDNIANKS